MLLTELFGDSARIKILEELISNWDYFLSVEELSRMSDVSKKSVYNHMHELDKIGILIIDDKGSKKFKLNPKDERAIALALIETGEYIRKAEEYENKIKNKESESEFLTLSTSDNDNTNLLKLNTAKTDKVMKSIPMINFIR